MRLVSDGRLAGHPSRRSRRHASLSGQNNVRTARGSTVRPRAGSQRLRTDPELFAGYVGEGESAKAVAKELRLEYMRVTWKDEDPGAAALVGRGVLGEHGSCGHLVAS
jgi:hypothetical protein